MQIAPELSVDTTVTYKTSPIKTSSITVHHMKSSSSRKSEKKDGDLSPEKIRFGAATVSLKKENFDKILDLAITEMFPDDDGEKKASKKPSKPPRMPHPAPTIKYEKKKTLMQAPRATFMEAVDEVKPIENVAPQVMVVKEEEEEVVAVKAEVREPRKVDELDRLVDFLLQLDALLDSSESERSTQRLLDEAKKLSLFQLRELYAANHHSLTNTS